MLNVLAPAETSFDQVLRDVSSQNSNIGWSRETAASTIGFGHEVANGAATVSRKLGLKVHTAAHSPGPAFRMTKTTHIPVAGGRHDVVLGDRLILS